MNSQGTGRRTLVLVDIENIFGLVENDAQIEFGRASTAARIIQAIKDVVPGLDDDTIWYSSVGMPFMSYFHGLTRGTILARSGHEQLALRFIRGLGWHNVQTVVVRSGDDAADKALLQVFELYRDQIDRVVLATQDSGDYFWSIANQAMIHRIALDLVGYTHTAWTDNLGHQAGRHLIRTRMRELKTLENQSKIEQITAGTDLATAEGDQVVDDWRGSSNPFGEMVWKVRNGIPLTDKPDEILFLRIARKTIEFLNVDPKVLKGSVVREMQRQFPDCETEKIFKVVDALWNTDMVYKPRYYLASPRSTFVESLSALNQSVAEA